MSNLSLLIAPVQIPNSYIIRLATLFITGDLKIINITSLRMFAKAPKYREPKSIHWKHYNFKILMESVEDYDKIESVKYIRHSSGKHCYCMS